MQLAGPTMQTKAAWWSAHALSIHHRAASSEGYQINLMLRIVRFIVRTKPRPRYVQILYVYII